jgi:hypothetical protein
MTHRSRALRFAAAGAALAVMTACASTERPHPPPRLTAARCTDPVTLDGRLDEPCWRTPPFDHFVVASAPGRAVPRTKVWLAWNDDHFFFAFDCEDDDVVAAPIDKSEHEVDKQDRVELFVGSGRDQAAYDCLELSPAGALHDYRARFYRQFDDDWKAPGFAYFVAPNDRDGRGYVVEAAVSRAELEALGLELRTGATWRIGLFRADFTHARPGDPTWITWVDAGLKVADFHVADSFGEVVLRGEPAPAQ